MKAADKLTLESVLLLIDVVHDGGQHRRLDFPHLRSRVLLARDLVESAETAPESGIKVVKHFGISYFRGAHATV